jgi:long-chain acyl-CoA synthetase
MVSRFLSRASRFPERQAYSVYPSGALKALGRLTWGEWLTQSRAVAGALLAQGARPGDRVAILSNNRPLWPITDLGVAMAGLITVGINTEAGPDHISHVLSDSGASLVVVDTLARLKTVRTIQGRSGQLFTIVCDDLDPFRTNAAEQLFEWQRWCAQGAEALETYGALREQRAARVDAISPDDIATLDYDNPGATGVQLSHRSALATTEALAGWLSAGEDDTSLAFQPFSQTTGKVAGMHLLIHSGASAALVESASELFVAAGQEEPTLVVGPARPFVKLYEAIELARDAKLQPRAVVAELLGARCRAAVVVGNALPHKVSIGLRNAGVALLAVYGKPEHLYICAHQPADVEGETIGRASFGNEIMIGVHDELQVRRNDQTFSGYFQRDEATRAAFTTDGEWWRSGEIAEIDDRGFVRIFGRLRDLVTLASGVKIDVTEIECALAETPLIAHAACFGNGRDYLVAVLSLRPKAVERWAQTRGLVAPWTALVQSHPVREELSLAIAAVNALLPAAGQVRKFAVTDQEFSVEGGELAPTHSLVRTVIEAEYRHVLNELYGS